MEVGYLIVPIRRLCAAWVRPRHEGLAATDLDLGLEGVGAVRVGLVRGSPVDQKNRHRPRSCGNPGESVGSDRPLVDVERETTGVGNNKVAGSMRSGSRQRHRHRPFVRPPQPCRFGLPVGPFDLGVFVVPPAHDHGQGIRLGRHEEAQPHRRREKALLRSLALLRRLLGETARRRRLVDVVLLVGIRTPLRLRAGWNQEAGQIPVRRSHPARQPLGCEGVSTPGADKVQIEGLDQTLAHLDGVGDGARVLLSCHVDRSGFTPPRRPRPYPTR